MTYEKAVKALINEKLINEAKTETAIKALKGHSVKFTYPDWAETLVEAGVLARLDVDKAADVMQESEDYGEEFNKALRRVGAF